MKKSFVIVGRALALSVVVFFIFNCAMSSSHSPDATRIDIHNPRALFVSQQGQGSGKAVDSQNQAALMELLNNGTMQVVQFKDKDGNQVNCTVMDVFQFNDSYVGLIYATDEGLHDVIAELATGKLLDFSAYLLEYAQIFGDTLVVPENSFTLWRINIPSRTAVAANNPVYLPIYSGGGIRTTYGAYEGVNRQTGFLVDSNLNILASSASGPYLLFADNTPPKGLLAPSDGALGYDGVSKSNYSAVFNGPDGSLYLIWFDRPYGTDHMKLSKFTFDTTGVHTNEITIDTGSVSVEVQPHRNSYSFQTYSRFIPCKDGYLRTYDDGAGKLAYEYVPITSMPTLPYTYGWDPHGFPLVSSDYVFWRSGNEIWRFKFSPGSSAEKMASLDSTLIWFEAVKGVLFFAKYKSSTAVETFRVDSPLANPVLVQSSDMAITSIVEF